MRSTLMFVQLLIRISDPDHLECIIEAFCKLQTMIPDGESFV